MTDTSVIDSFGPEPVKTKVKRAPTEYNKFCAETLKTLSSFPPKERLTECGRLWKIQQTEKGKLLPPSAAVEPVVKVTEEKKEPTEKKVVAEKKKSAHKKETSLTSL